MVWRLTGLARETVDGCHPSTRPMETLLGKRRTSNVCLQKSTIFVACKRNLKNEDLKKHPDKEVQQAIEYAKSKGWRIEAAGSSSHAWGRLKCPHT